MKDLIVKINQDSSLQKIKAAYIDDSVKLTESEKNYWSSSGISSASG